MSIPLSLLDFCTIYEGESAADSFARSVELAQLAERSGYRRIWYTEHHNMKHVSSSSPAVLIAHVAAHTSSIRLGSGGIMLPNHPPYLVAEQFGTLAHLHPGRIDLGVGRAPGTDMNTLGRALRRSADAASRFPQDVAELRSYLSTGPSTIPGVTAVPGHGTEVPIYILGSSLFGASLAAQLGLPFAFASHFAPTHLQAAARSYRDNYQPSKDFPEPYFLAGVNVLVADSQEQAARDWEVVCLRRVKNFAGGANPLSDAQTRALMDSQQGRQILQMVKYSAVGNPSQVRDYLQDFASSANADELIISPQAALPSEVVKIVAKTSDLWLN